MTLRAAARRHSPVLVLVSAAALMVMMSLPASALDSETCFSRQHQSVTVNVRQALSRAAAMNLRLVRSERDCVLACCSEDVQAGSRCNMAVFKAVQLSNDENCLLFHCPSELDCPLMKAQDGTNTYNIYKGLTHPPTPRPVTMTTTIQTTTTTAPTTTIQPTTQAPPTTTPAPPTTTEPPPPILIITRTPAVMLPSTATTTPPPPPTSTTTTTTTTAATKTTTTTATTTTAATTTTTTAATTTTTTAATTTTTAATTKTTTTISTSTGFSPALDSKKPNKSSKKQNKTTKKIKPHPVSTTQPTPSSTTSLPVQMVEVEPRTMNTTQIHTEATTTAPPTTPTISTTPPTSTSTPPPTESSTTAPPSLVIIPKDIFQSDHLLQSGHALQNSSTSQGKAAQGALRSGLVVFMVLGLAVLTLALAVGGRKAMESFDRRHYTRLELNDLHYEI